MPPETFFNQKHCDRCGNDLPVRIMSFFTDETICTECRDKEKIIRNKIERKEGPGADRKYEGYGRIPSMEDDDGESEI